jgi:membrane associated rhomboid family serine protease/Tfp pilus assembly protein PilF/transcription elongation factor Elf1
MPEKFACPACGSENIILKLDKGKEAECRKCKIWSAIPEATSQTDEPLNCRVRLKNSVLDLPPKTDQGVPSDPETGKEQDAAPEKRGYRELSPFEKPQEDEPEAFRNLLKGAAQRTLVTRALLIANALVFILAVSSGADFFMPHLLDLIKFGGKYNYRILAQNEWWRLVTSFFIQGGIYHFGLNMWFLWTLGNIAERLFGNPAFFLIYAACGLCGSITSFLVSPNVVSTCASASVLGIAGGLVGYIVSGKTHIPKIYVRKIIQDLVLLCAASIALGFFIQVIDNAASLAGLAVGFASGFLLARSLPVSGKEPGKYSWAAFIAGCMIVVFIGVSGGLALYKDKNGKVVPDTPRVIELLSQRKIDQAIELVNEKPELLASVPNREFIDGLLYIRRGDTDHAVKSFSESMRKNPADISLRLYIAQVYIDSKLYARAIEVFREIIGVAPKDAIAHGNLGWVYYLEGDFHTCIALSEKALELDKSLSYVKYNIAICKLRLGDTHGAIEYYKGVKVSNSEESKSAREGAIEDLRDLIRKNVKKDEAELILKEVFGQGEYEKDQNDVSA